MSSSNGAIGRGFRQISIGMDLKKEIEVLSKYGTATIHEALGRIGDLPPQIKPLKKNQRLIGTAYPVKLKPGNNVLLHRAYAYAKPEDIIIVDCQGGYDYGYWGDLLTTGAMKQGIKGLVIDGSIRDADEIEDLNFPVFCRGFCIKGTTKDPEGTLNETITIGDCIINPGDIVIGDRDGVVVVPKERLKEAIEKSEAREQKEANVRAQLLEGKTSLEIYGWDKKFGY